MRELELELELKTSCEWNSTGLVEPLAGTIDQQHA